MHLWLRAEIRDNEQRSALTPDGVKQLVNRGFQVTVEDARQRCIPTQDYADAGATIVRPGQWVNAPMDAVILGLKELPDDGSDLRHQHIMFGHAFKGQHDGPALLRRFRSGGGTLLDLEYLVDDAGRRLAAFGYWAGYAGAAVSLLALAAARQDRPCPPVTTYPSAHAMARSVKHALTGDPPTALIIGALGRVGSGARDLCKATGVATTNWDMAETAHGGPFPEILDHDLFLNCILAGPDTPPFLSANTGNAPRKLRVIGDIACDPGSDYNPIPLYDHVTNWKHPVLRVADTPSLDIMAIDNLPSLLPIESTKDFAQQLLPLLKRLDDPSDAVWARARASYAHHSHLGAG